MSLRRGALDSAASGSRARRSRRRRPIVPRRSASSPFPATGSAPRSWPPRASVLAALGDFELDEHLVGGASIDAHGTRAHRRGARRLPRRRRRAAGRRGRPEVGHAPTPPRRAPSRACSACARASACSPTCARCGPARRCSTPARSSASDRGHRPAGGARADRRHLLRRLAAATATRAHDTCVYSVGEIERIARVGFELARTEGHQRGQGERARDLAAVAQDRRRACARGVRGRPARAHAGRQRRDAAGRRGRRTST